jgi:rhodanese-related sulfurtransferase
MTFHHFVSDNWLMFSILSIGILLYLLDDELIFSGIDIIAPQELVHLVNSGALCLDVRELSAYKKGHIAGAIHVGSAEDVDKKITRGQTVVIYCDHGVASGNMVVKLKNRAITRICLLRDGIKSWEKENYPVVK